MGRAVFGLLAYAVLRWLRWRATRRTRREIRVLCELREQRMEDADVPSWWIVDLHALVYAAFAHDVLARTDIEPLLDRFTEISIQRRWYQRHIRRAPVRFHPRWRTRMTALDDRLAELDALIRLYCERAIYGRTTSSPARSSLRPSRAA